MNEGIGYSTELTLKVRDKASKKWREDDCHWR